MSGDRISGGSITAITYLGFPGGYIQNNSTGIAMSYSQCQFGSNSIFQQVIVQGSFTVTSPYNGTFGGNLAVNGSFQAYGGKNAVVRTRDYGERLLNAYETPEYYFADYGRNVIQNGQCIVAVEDIFKQTVNTNIAYDVHITPYSNHAVWVDVITPDYFIVRADTNDDVVFSWNLVAKRLGYEHHRLEKFTPTTC